MLLRNRERGGNKRYRERIEAEKKRTKNRTLGNTRGNMSRCRIVIANGDRLGAISTIGFYPRKD